MGYYDFNKDIKDGLFGEEKVINFFIETQGYKLERRNNTIDYDFELSFNGTTYTYENKTDFFEDTGNIAIEFECRGKASGINATKADYFTTYFDKSGELWKISCRNLRALIKKINPRTTQYSGDKGSRTRLYLIPKNQVKHNFQIYNLK